MENAVKGCRAGGETGISHDVGPLSGVRPEVVLAPRGGPQIDPHNCY